MNKFFDNEITCAAAVFLLGIDAFAILCAGFYSTFKVPMFAYCNMYMGTGISTEFTGVLMLSLFVLLAVIIRSAGHYRGSELAKNTVIDRIPIEIVYTVLGMAFFFFGWGVAEFSMQIYDMYVEAGFPRAVLDSYTGITADTLANYILDLVPFPVFALCFGGMYFSLIFMVTTTVRRLKTKTFLSTSLLWITGVWCARLTIRCFKVLNRWAKGLFYTFSDVKITAKFTIACVILYMIEFYLLITVGDWNPGGFWIWSTIICIGVYVTCARWILGYRKIEDGIEHISNGETDYQISKKYMPKGLEKSVDSLNNISRAVAASAQKQIKAERFRTELITNVSHDLKTPLTSIINYVDLLSAEPMESEKRKEYIGVLQRQSSRLKKLLFDLVEASKASTGNINTVIEPTNISTLLNQAAGEYTDKAKKRGLEISMDLPENDIYLNTDGRLLWRVFDNLLNNACKYSMPGTRIYMSRQKEENRRSVTFKNISKERLNISADELMERFVRGDSSRNTEGSGLGLSIAQSLTEILGGKLEISIDGDLFKAIVKIENRENQEN